MIVGRKKNTFSLLFSLNGSVLPRILPRILAVAAFAAGAVWIDETWMNLQHANAAAFAVFGIALSLFLGFRNNAAYERWWEARRLWGGLIADMRALSREAELFLDNRDRRHRLLRMAAGFLHLHRLDLRQQPADEDALRWLPDAAIVGTAHPPSAALDAMSAELAEARKAGELDGFGARALAERLASITLAQAGSERIATTPLPFVYSLLVYRTTFLYCILLPLGLIEVSGWLTPLFAAVVAYVFFGLAEVTEELETPFSFAANGLPLNAMCRTVEISLAPHLDLPVPEKLRAVRGRLD